MDAFVTAFTSLFSGIFSAIISALSSVGELLFVVGETGLVTGVAPFGWVLIVGIAVPLATWFFNKIFTWVRGLGRSGR